MTTQGTVTKVLTTKGFGFITSDDHEEFFFHLSACADFASMREGQRVTFNATRTSKGPRAEKVIPMDATV